jgi:hypothetical protein
MAEAARLLLREAKTEAVKPADEEHMRAIGGVTKEAADELDSFAHAI